MKYKVAVSDDFFDAIVALPKSKQSKALEFVSKFRSNPLSPGINYEKLNSKYDQKLYSARVDDAYRAIIAREEGTGVFLLLWVDHHDEAYAWAESKRVKVNSETGSLQIYDVEVVLPTAESVETPTAPESKPAVFAFLSDGDLKRLGVPEELFFLVRAIMTDKDFINAQKYLPPEAYQSLEFAKDGESVDDIVDIMYGGDRPQDAPQDMATALDNPVSKMKFFVAEGEEELKAALNAPLDKWRIFLHPYQRRIVEKNFKGPAKVLGGAGTGKTVVAMHRAHYLAGKCGENEKILFTTFTANLAQDIRENLRKICTSEEMKKIEVVHLDAWISQFLKQQNYEYTIVYGDEISKLWSQAKANSGESFDYPDDFFEDEWRSVVQAKGIETLQEYAITQRVGRGIRLNRKDRIRVWKVFEEYRTLMDQKKIRDNAAVMNECCQILVNQPDYHPYKHIIVDEGQDFGMGAYRLLRTLAGDVHDNDLFIVGDAHQRIYKNKVILSKCRVDVRGRSSRLRINYRTTEEIRDWAMHVLKGISFDDLDEGLDSEKGYKSLTHGDAPFVEKYDSINKEIEALIEHIKEMKYKQGYDYAEMCVVARTSPILEDYKKAIEAAGIKTYEVRRSKTDDRGMPGVRLATMHRVKGLEFTCMFLVGMNKGNMPLKKAIEISDEEARKEAIISERSLLYVALTRAKKFSYVMGYGKMSEFVTA